MPKSDSYRRLEKVFKFGLEIQNVLEAVDQRCAAADGPVTPTNREITSAELRQIYTLALKIKATAA